MQLFYPKVSESLVGEQSPQFYPDNTTSETAVAFLLTIERDAIGVKINLSGNGLRTEDCLLVFCVF